MDEIQPAVSSDAWDAIRRQDSPRRRAADRAIIAAPPIGHEWREVRDPHVSVHWRCVEGQMQHWDDLHGWLDASWWGNREGWHVTPERVAMWAELYARPSAPCGQAERKGY